MTDDAIVLTDVSKRYIKLEERAMLLRSLLPFGGPTRSEFQALRHVNLRVGRGETLGLIGRNGAGKTTMLRLLAGVSRPTEGSVRVVGRIAPLISVGVGFHKEMSGRENVLVNGMLLGLTRDEVASRFDDIVGFAELADFIDTPVKFYSSGMFMRLGFSVAIHTDPQVLLVDEVLAVGDQAFQSKCLTRMRDIREAGTTIVLVSHSMPAIRMLCSRTALMHRGELVFDGDTEEAIGRHHELLSSESEHEERRAGDHDQQLVGGAVIDTMELVGPGGPVHYAERGQPLTLRISVRFSRDVESPMFMLMIIGKDGSTVYGLRSPIDHRYRRYQAGDVATAEFRFTANLSGGTFRVQGGVATADGRDVLAMSGAGVSFFVEPRPLSWGLADLEGSVLVDGEELVEERFTELGDRASDGSQARSDETDHT